MEVSFGEPLVKLKPLTFNSIFWNTIYVGTTIIFVIMVSELLVFVLCDDRTLPYRTFKLAGLVYVGLATIGGVMRTKSRTVKKRRYWTHDHLLIPFLIALMFALSLVRHTLAKFEKLEFQGFVGMLAILIPAFFASWASVTFFSFAASFVTVFFAFSQEKVN
jgi:hypothetical protein